MRATAPDQREATALDQGEAAELTGDAADAGSRAALRAYFGTLAEISHNPLLTARSSRGRATGGARRF
ncbi:hypothetical protein [Actinospica sp.]|uniref:hypothetical protein n=1 Tax=Actinospica sp. TaxID=1872142 RepID=UPI002C6FFBB8|nr:hypothetical protein [Actinospica sp.]HWG24667.1 hypothetical protein [Actinospica sp.]